MSPVAPPDATFPPLASTILQAAGQHAGTALAALLAAWGVSQPSQSTEIVSVVSSVVVLAGSLGWTYLMHRIYAQKAQAAAVSAAVTGIAPK